MSETLKFCSSETELNQTAKIKLNRAKPVPNRYLKQFGHPVTLGVR